MPVKHSLLILVMCIFAIHAMDSEDEKDNRATIQSLNTNVMIDYLMPYLNSSDLQKLMMTSKQFELQMKKIPTIEYEHFTVQRKLVQKNGKTVRILQVIFDGYLNIWVSVKLISATIDSCGIITENGVAMFYGLGVNEWGTHWLLSPAPMKSLVSNGGYFGGIDKNGRARIWVPNDEVIDPFLEGINVPIKSIFKNGHDGLVGISENGQVFEWGFDCDGVEEIPLKGKKAKLGATNNYNHLGFITEEDEVIAFQHDRNLGLEVLATKDQLKHEKLNWIGGVDQGLVVLTDNKKVIVFGEVRNKERADGKEAKSITSNGRAAAIISTEDEIILLGDFEMGGFLEHDVMDQLKNKKIKKIVSGKFGFVALTEDGKIITWGKNGHRRGVPPNETQTVLDVYTIKEDYEFEAVTSNDEFIQWGWENIEWYFE